MENLSWLNNLDGAVEVLAHTAIEGRKRRVVNTMKVAMQKQAIPEWLEGARTGLTNFARENVVAPLAQQFTDEAGINDLTKHLGWGLAGAGVGAGIGGLSQAFVPARKRRTLSSMFQGGALGGVMGAGASVAHTMAGNAGAGEDEVNAARIRADEQSRNEAHAQVSNPVLDEVERTYRTPGGRIEWLADAARHQGWRGAHQAFLESEVRDRTGFSLPEGHPLAGEFSRHEVPNIALRPHGFTGDQLRGLTTPELRNQFIEQVMNSYNDPNNTQFMRHAPTANDPNATGQWTRGELSRRLEPELLPLAHRDRGTYRWAMPTNQHEQTVTDSLLSEMRQAHTGTGRSLGSGFLGMGRNWDALTNNVQQGHAAFAARNPGLGIARYSQNGLGLGNYFGAGRASNGFFEEMERGLTPNNRDINPDDPQFSDMRSSGFHPVEVAEAYRRGPEGITDLINEAYRQRRTVAPGGREYTREELRSRVPTMVAQMRDQLQQERDEDRISLPFGLSVPRPTTVARNTAGNLRDVTAFGSLPHDMLAGVAGADIVTSGFNNLLNLYRGNPQDLQRALSRLTPQQMGISQLQHDYLTWIEGVHGTPGLRQTFQNPLAFANSFPGNRVNFEPGSLLGSLGEARSAIQSNPALNHPSVALGNISRNLRGDLFEIARGVNEQAADAIMARVNSGAMSPQLASEELIQLTQTVQNAGELASSRGLNFNQLLAANNTVNQIESAMAGGMPHDTAQTRIGDLIREGIRRPGVAGTLDLGEFTNNFAQTLETTAGSNVASRFRSLPDAARQQIMEQVVAAEGTGQLPFQMARSGQVPINELISPVRSRLGPQGANLNPTELAEALDIIRNNRDVGSYRFNVPGQAQQFDVPYADLRRHLSEAEGELANTSHTVPIPNARGALNRSMTGAAPEINVPGNMLHGQGAPPPTSTSFLAGHTSGRNVPLDSVRAVEQEIAHLSNPATTPAPGITPAGQSARIAGLQGALAEVEQMADMVQRGQLNIPNGQAQASALRQLPPNELRDMLVRMATNPDEVHVLPGNLQLDGNTLMAASKRGRLGFGEAITGFFTRPFGGGAAHRILGRVGRTARAIPYILPAVATEVFHHSTRPTPNRIASQLTEAARNPRPRGGW